MVDIDNLQDFVSVCRFDSLLFEDYRACLITKFVREAIAVCDVIWIIQQIFLDRVLGTQS